MLRIIALIGVGFVLTSGAFAQMGGVPRPYMGLSGFIHTVREEAYNCSGDSAEKPWRVNEVTYDRRGNETWRAYYNPDGSVGHQAGHTYDNDGNETGWAEYYSTSEIAPAGLHKHADYTLSGGRVISVVVYKEDTPEYRTTREYDKRGNKIREVTVEIGCCTTTRTFKYDARNRQIENTYDADGLSSVQRRDYDAAGHVIKEVSYDKGVLIAKTTRVYEGGQLIKEVTTWGDGDTRTTTHSYNKAGELFLITIDDASITSRTTIEYHANGKIRSSDRVAVAKVGGKMQDSEAEPRPGRILEKYDVRGDQVERYVFDYKGILDLTQLSTYDRLGRQIRLTETSSLGPSYNRDLVYNFDSHGNKIAAFCRNVTAAGEERLLRAEKRIITYYND